MIKTNNKAHPIKTGKVFIKNLNFFSTEERMTWTSWMTWG